MCDDIIIMDNGMVIGGLVMTQIDEPNEYRYLSLL
jgi:hypothetical protein